jgi:hypothetical protein
MRRFHDCSVKLTRLSRLKPKLFPHTIQTSNQYGCLNIFNLGPYSMDKQFRIHNDPVPIWFGMTINQQGVRMILFQQNNDVEPEYVLIFS